MPIIVTEAAGRQRTFHLTPHGLTIGRDPQNDVAIDDPSISRMHAQIIIDVYGPYVADLGSESGTFVNGRAVTSERIAAGDVVRVGGMELIVSERVAPPPPGYEASAMPRFGTAAAGPQTVACPQCGQAIMAGAILCKHCGAQLGTPQRPKGVTWLAVLLFVGTVVCLVSIPGQRPVSSFFLGVQVPVPFTQFLLLVSAGIDAFCGYGFLKLKRSAMRLYIGFSCYGILNTLASLPASYSLAMRLNPYAESSTVLGPVIAMVVLGLAFSGFIIYYLVSRKDYFVN